MIHQSVDPSILHAWLLGRSVARGVPPPVVDRGGFRVDSHTDTEISRWVFAEMGSGLRELAHAIRDPRYFLKLCGDADELRSALPNGWQIHASNYFMQMDTEWRARPLVKGYGIEVCRNAAVVEVRIWSDAGALAASGYAGETRDAFVYDRIVTAPDHRRKGLGRAIMTALHAAKDCPATPELLVATEDGRTLYSKLGWQTISPYSTASIAVPQDRTSHPPVR